MNKNLASEADRIVAAFDSQGFTCNVEYGDNEFTITPRAKPDNKFYGLFNLLRLYNDDRPRLSPNERAFVLSKTEGKCFYCDVELTGAWHVDHVSPRIKGGADQFENYVPACVDCNLRKHARIPTNSERERLNEINEKSRDCR